MFRFPIRQCFVFLILNALTLTILISSAFSQSESGSAAIEGKVLDQNGAVVSGSSISIQNKETGLQRTATTNAAGTFNVPVLPVGRYTVKVEASGFGPAERDDVLLRVGQTTTADFSLKPATVKEGVTVTPDPESLDTQENAAGSVVTPRAIEDLPARGRNFSEYVLLTPSVLQEPDRFGLVISGQRSINSNVAIDGADFSDPLQGNQRGGNEAVFFFPQTAIREFQVVRAGASSEVGRTTAGFVNAVTKSGTNAFHGEAFYFNRNRALTSSDAFGNQKLNNQQNQFGGSVGGPLKHDRAFFFVGIEQNFLHIPFIVTFLTPPSGVAVPSSLQSQAGQQQTSNNPTALFGRVDVNLTKRNSLNVQYTYSRLHGENFNFDNNTTVTSNAASTNFERIGTSNGIKSSLVSVINPNVVNEVRGQIATDDRNENPNVNAPQVTISDLGTFGGDTARPRLFETTRYEISDNLTWNTGGHHFRFGFDANVNRVRQQRESNTQARWDFETRINSGALVADGLQNYLAVRPRRYRQTFPVGGPDSLIFHGTQKELAFFLNDRVNLSRSITLTAGLRWEGQWNPQPTSPNPAVPETGRIPNDLRQWQPRLGAAWDVNGKGRTVVRLSAGLFDARTPANLFQRVFTDNGLTTVQIDISEPSACRNSTDPNRAGCSLRGPNAIITFPNVFTAPPAAAFIAKPRVFGFDPTFRNPRSFQGSGTVEQSIGKDMVFTAGYTHSATWALQRRRDRNLFPPTINAQGTPIFPTTRPNPNIGWLSINESTAHQTYDALILGLTQRLTNRMQFQINYTLSRNRDDDSNERNFSRETALNPFDFSIERAPSKYDQRHTLTINGLYDLGRGFTMSAAVLSHAGVPFNPVIGTDQQNDTNDDNDRAIINGVVAGRNSLRQPVFFNLDLRLLKAFRFGETRRLALSVEAFNVTRNTNKGFGNDAISIYGVPLANGAPSVATAGQPLFAPSTLRFGGPRQLQLGLRYTF